MEATLVTAVSARQSADQPTALVNEILKRIKNDSRFGVTRIVHCAEALSENGIDFVVENLMKLGFEVQTVEDTNAGDNSAYPEFKRKITEFLISW